MTEMACKDILKQLSDYIEGDIPPALMSELEAHIDGCENCRIVLDTTRKTIKLYHRHAEDQQAPDRAVEHLYHTLKLDDFLPPQEANG